MGRFDLVQPSLIKQLRSILDQYQDDGQILKELIQNAEDARATEVKFLLDENEYDKKGKHLHHPDLATYQGEALYAYNNATFSDRDWVGLKMINDSVKKTECLKVGRFGLGFKSVFHMTDLPSVISADKVSFIDPHEKFFSEDGKKVTGFSWHLKDDYKVMKKIPGQFESYRGLFGCSDATFKQGHYDGTLFRFPLRKQASQISSNLYSASKVLQIFKSYQTIAELSMLFLTSIESIELYHRAPGQATPQLIFRVIISPESLHNVRLQRGSFLSRFNGQPMCTADNKVIYAATIDCITYHSPVKISKQSSTFLTCHFSLGRNSISDELSALLSDSSRTNLTPWTGAAVRIDVTSARDAPDGHVFCFLPLPLQKTSMTGLPIHINGFFSVSSNRHQLKWPSITQSNGERETVGNNVTDRACLWNQLLIEEVVPRTYYWLLHEMIELSKKNPKNFTSQFVYSLIPDTELVNDNWKPLLPLLFKLLSHTELIQSDSSSAWLQFQKVILLSDTPIDKSKTVAAPNCSQVLLTALKLSGVNAALVPKHLAFILHNHMGAKEMFATPELMRLVTKKKPRVLSALGDDDKISLLGYLLSDEAYEQLNGLPLLPLSDGEFTTFSTDYKSPRVYIPGEAHPAAVLPMMSHQFLDSSNRIDETTLNYLTSAASKESVQLRLFTHTVFVKLLPTVLNERHLLESSFYSEVLWEYILANNSELSRFEDLPLLLATDENEQHAVFQLDKSRPILYRHSTTGASLADPQLISALNSLGVRLAYKMPQYLIKSNIVFNIYVFPPTAQGLKSVLLAYSKTEEKNHLTNLVTKLASLTSEQKVKMRQVLSKLTPGDLNPGEVDFLSSLPIFSLAGGRDPDMFISASRCSSAASHDCPPLPECCPVIDISDAASKSLVELIPSIQELSPAGIVLQHVIPKLSAGELSGPEIDLIMFTVLQNLGGYSPRERASLVSALRSLPFLLREDGRRVAASEAFDPTEPRLAELLYQEGVFPTERFATPAIIDSLRLLGLKSAADVTSADLIQTAKRIEELSLLVAYDKKSLIDKSMALLNHLNEQPLLAVKDAKLAKILKNTCWVTPLKQPPANYPHSLSWYNPGMCVVSPDAITTDKHINKVSSVMSILPSAVCDTIQQVLGWDREPDILFVVEHLSNMITSYRASEKGSYMHMLSDLYSYLQTSERDNRTNALKSAKLESWVWYGDGFISPDRVTLEKSQISLTPYVHPLPAEMSEFQSLFVQHDVWDNVNIDLYLVVLELIRDKYTQIELFDPDEVKSDLKLTLELIDQIKPAPGELLSPQIAQRLLVPTSDCDRKLTLVSVRDVTYCDTTWLSERRSQLEGHESVTLIHPSISNELAEALGVPSLVNRMLDTDTFELGEGFGQSEPLTRRLQNLLKEYSDGFAVPKELIQNADDAGATEVKFLYDERTNQDALNCLIDDGMRECQGPALWFYNNATFTDSDFEAIIKLSGATKSRETEKIGGFGLGFNAVYNLTDVPSFVSRNYVVIFDPHTTHLGKSIPDSNKPGIKIDLARNHKALSTLKNQFKPYTGIFGCDLRHRGHGVNYDGTLFRFPLRTAQQAVDSDISSLHYDRQQVLKLLDMLGKSCDSLLLFTQNVRRISVYHMNEFETPQQAKLLFSCNKEPIKYIRELHVPINLPATVKDLTEDEQEFTRQSSILKAASAILQEMKQTRKVRTPTSVRMQRLSLGSRQNLPVSSLLMKVRYKMTLSGCQILRNSEGPKDESTPWLVTSSLGDGEALDQSLKLDGLTPVGGVAVQLCYDGATNESLVPAVLRDKQTDTYSGTVFCYLPLPICSKLPVHINGAFAVSSNRRHLLERVSDNKTNDLVEWNRCLLSDSVRQSYYLMLEDLRSICGPGVAPFYLLWPRISEAVASCVPLVTAFYAGLCHPTSELELFSRNDRWAPLSTTLMIEPALRDSPIYAQTFAVLDLVLTSSKSHIVLDIPDDVRLGFVKAGCEESIVERTLTRDQLYERIIFPNINKFDVALRDSLILYALDCNERSLNEMLRSYACIPTLPSGERLRFVQDLVHPDRAISVLYTPDDERFPHGTVHTYLSTQRLAFLESLGMLSELPDTEVLERAQSVRSCFTIDPTLALSRVTSLLQYMDRKLEFYPDLYNDIQKVILSTPFLPVSLSPSASEERKTGKDPTGKETAKIQKVDAEKETGKGLTFPSDSLFPPLLPPSRLSPAESLPLVCLVKPVLDRKQLHGVLSARIQKYLGLNKQPTLEDVLTQLKVLRENEREAISKSYELVKSICDAIYQYLQDINVSSDILKALSNFILIGDRLVTAQLVCKSGTRDCQPYLYDLPFDLHKYEHLLRRAGVKEKFDVGDYVRALRTLTEEAQDAPLDSRQIQITLNLATQLNALRESNKLTIADIEAQYSGVCLPDSTNQMRPSASLCFNDCSWLPDQQDMLFAHNLIPYQVAKGLGVNTKRQETIRTHSHGIPFGQKEKLTKRLKRIMSSYPCGREILKELVQNADDAGATVIHFVSDQRQHSTEKVFEDCWKPLQGPALCVYNNRPFSQADLEGIQNLGEGSKGADPNRTGQYGVGFNSVYHLTDSPSFLTGGPEVGEVLCAFDPHCRFVPGATPNEPGRMFNDVTSLRDVFHDVFQTYLPAHFSTDGGTVFRFPLRSKEMAVESKISNTPVTTETISDLVGRFRAEMFDVLLFVNHLEEVTISDIPKAIRGLGGQLENSYTVRARLTPRYAKIRKEFTEYVKQVGTKLKSGEITIQQVECKEVSYKMTIEDSLGLKETWLIVQRIGFLDASRLPLTVIHAHSTGELALLPRGGVACLLNRQLPAKSSKSSHPAVNRPNKVFCFLPLPIQTKLPVHINGHFALDHEARRGLWRDEDGGARSDWNEALISRVICPAYQRLIEACREKSFPSLDGVTSHMHLSRATELLATYHGMFPSNQTDDTWQGLVVSLYRTIGHSTSRLFPVLNTDTWQDDSCSDLSEEVEGESSGSSKPDSDEPETIAEISWFPLLGQSDDIAFFSDQSASGTSDDVITALIAGGFNILHTPYEIYDSFKQAGILGYMMSPSSVVEFLRSNRLLMPDLPVSIDATPFCCRETLLEIIDYCKTVPGISYQLDDLPFGLAQDGLLHYLGEDDRLFFSQDNSLVPECSDLFLHSDIVSSGYLDIPEDIEQVRVFKRFGVEEFGLYINQTLGSDFCPSGDLPFMRWDPDSNDKPNRAWLSQVWAFLANKCQPIISDLEDDPAALLEHLEVTLFALHSWCLLPVYASPDILSNEPADTNNDSLLVEEPVDGKEGSALREISKKLSMSRSRMTGSFNSLTGSMAGPLEDREHVLVSLQHAHMAMDFSSKETISDPMKQALRKLKIPELHHKLVDGKTNTYGKAPTSTKTAPPVASSSTASAFARLLCAKVSDPGSMLDCLLYCVKRVKNQKKNLQQVLHTSECNLLLKYFSEALFSKTLRRDEGTLMALRQLPFYVALSGQQTDLGECQVYILPQGIPSNEIDAWRSRAGVLFLQRNDSLEHLFNFLGCQALTDIQVYCQFIFKHFEFLSDDARLTHLTYIRDRMTTQGVFHHNVYMKLPTLSDDEKGQLLAELTTLKFIRDLKPAPEEVDNVFSDDEDSETAEELKTDAAKEVESEATKLAETGEPKEVETDGPKEGESDKHVTIVKIDVNGHKSKDEKEPRVNGDESAPSDNPPSNPSPAVSPPSKSAPVQKAEPETDLFPASCYFDAENRLFQLMLDKSHFPPPPFDNYRWIRFLRLIGLTSEVSNERFIDFARDIAASRHLIPLDCTTGKHSQVVVAAEEKAKALVQLLYRKFNIASDMELLEEISYIPFICAAEANSKFHHFSCQFGFDETDAVFISFRDSLTDSKENMRCAWTSAFYLPHWADPSQLKSTELNFDYHESDPLSSMDVYKQEIATQLGVLSSPTTSQIVTHSKNISKTVLQQPANQNDRKPERSTLLHDVMKSVYRYMHDHCMDENMAAEELVNTPCVLIDGGKLMVKANQLVVNLYEEQQIKPFLYKTPSELSDFNSLFKYLGATERATAEQFAAVLDQLYAQHEGEKLDPNSLRCAYRSVKGLFTLLSKGSTLCEISTLYLPSQDARLVPAADLVYNDEVSFSERLHEFSLPFLVDLRECKLHISYFSDVTSKLPPELRPMLLTEIVEECLSEDCETASTQAGAASVLKSRLTSSEFTSGILRLIRHDHLERAEKPKQSALKTVHKALKNIQVIPVDMLITHLKYNGEIINSSQSEAECFVTKSKSHGGTSWCLYVQTSAEINAELLVKVAEIVNRVAGGLLQNSIIYLHPILSCGTYEIPMTLDRLRIRQDHHAAKSPTLQPPGSFISSDMHHLLKQDFVEFQPDEYVGYELDDPAMNQQLGDATYIYAIILEKLPVECAMFDRSTQRFFDRYRINIGDEEPPLIVSTTDLYRLHRVIEKPQPKERILSTNSEIFVDVLTTNESGDYLLLSPGVKEEGGDLDEVIEEREAEEDEGDEVEESQTKAAGKSAEETAEPEEETEVILETWEETTTIHVPPSEPEQPIGDQPDSKPRPQPEAEQSPSNQKTTPNKTSNNKSAEENTAANKQAAAEAAKFDYPEIKEENLEEIKKLLTQQVRAVWKLPEEQRKKIIKRIMLKFHPDKNPQKSDLCTQLTQHIRAIIEDIEDGGFVADAANRGDWWSEFINRRAKAYGEQKNDFEDKLKETYAKYTSNLGPDFESPNKGPKYDSSKSHAKFQQFKSAARRNPVPAEARRWMAQSRADLQSAYNDMNAETPAYEWAQFKAYQCAEKVLKCANYTLDSKKVNLSDLKLISSALRDTVTSDLARNIAELVGPPDHVTYPGSAGFPRIPHELREQQQTEQILSLVEELVSHIDKNFLQVMEEEMNPKPESPESPTDNESMALVLVPKSAVKRDPEGDNPGQENTEA